MCQGEPTPSGTTISSRPYSPAVSSLPILIVWSIPSSQNASPSSASSVYPAAARSCAMVLMPHSLLNVCYAQLSVKKQLQRELSQDDQALSSPSAERLRCWRLYFESAMALVDVLDAELERDAGISQRWYDVLVHLEESPHGIPMNALADRILYSKSGFTRVVDRMEEAGLISRLRPEHDRRTILVVLTTKGTATLERARAYHRDGIERHFAQHLSDADVKALTRALEKVSTHARP